ncbi:hypothetical protein [Mesorhizobium sp. M0478]|uniref:hypothetical protein n=1 Tax=unclassified Mesorhizobium TaxID=325217 RepID=UPI00333ABB36
MKLKPIHFERSWPYVGAVAVVAIWLYVGGDSTFPSDPLPMLAAAGTVASVLVGFIITAETIVLGLTGTPVFKKLAATGYAGMLFNYLHEALWGALCFLVVSFLGFFTLQAPTPPLQAGGVPEWFATLFVACAVGSILLFVRISIILSSLLKNASKS